MDPTEEGVPRQSASTNMSFNEKVEELAEKLEKVEKDVILTFQRDNSANETDYVSNKNTDDIYDVDQILEKWTGVIQNRYRCVGEIDEECVQSLILHIMRNKRTDVEVKDEMYRILNEMDTTEFKEDILKCMNNYNNKDDSVKEVTPMNMIDIEIKHIINTIKDEKLIKKLKSLKDSVKYQFLIEYKTVEYAKFMLLVRVKEFNEPLSTTLQKFKVEEKELGPEEKYANSCEEKLELIFNDLSILETASIHNYNDLFYLVVTLTAGLERFPYHCKKLEIYDKILSYLDAQLYVNNVNLNLKELENLKKVTVMEQWEKFAKQKKNVQEILHEYITLNTLPNKDEFDYHLENMIEYEKIKSNEIYDIVNYLNQLEIDDKREDINTIASSIIEKGDRMKYNEIDNFLKDKLNYQNNKWKQVETIKNKIIEEYKKRSEITNVTIRNNYINIIKIYLDKIDWLIAEHNLKDFSYSQRLNLFQNLEQSLIVKTTPIEDEISKILCQIVFGNSKEFPLNILDHFEQFMNKDLPETEYMREAATKNSVKLEDIFCNNGKMKKEEAENVFFRGSTVVVNMDSKVIYYRLSDNINLLKGNVATYQTSIEQFSEQLSFIYKKYKLHQLKMAIKNYNAKKNLKTFMNLSNHLLFYLTLREDHINCGDTFKNIITTYLTRYHETVKYLMINDKKDQQIIIELRTILDMFCQELVDEKILWSLRKTLTHKTYKETGFKFFAEEIEQTTKHLKLNKLLEKELIYITEESLPEIMQLRSCILPPNDAKIFFQDLQKLITTNLTNLEATNVDGINLIKTYLKNQKDNIIFNAVTDEKCIRDFIKNLTIPQSIDKQIYQKLNYILRVYEEKISTETLEKLINEISQLNVTTSYSDSLLSDALKLFICKLETQKEIDLKDYELKEEAMELLELSLINTLNVWQIDRNYKKKISYTDFLKHLKLLIRRIKLPQFLLGNDTSKLDIRKIKKALEDVETRFIIGILEISYPSANQIIFKKYPQQLNDQIMYLRYVLQLPNDFFKSRNDYKQFLKQLIKDGCDENEFMICVKELIRKYYELFLSNIVDDILTKSNSTYANIKTFVGLNPPSSDIELIPRIKLNISLSLKRLFDNISVKDFINYASKWLEYEAKSHLTNFILLYCEPTETYNLDHIPKFLYNDEKVHFEALLKFDTSNATIKEKLKKIFHSDSEAPVTNWLDELIDLRLNTIRDFVLQKLAVNNEATPISDILNAFRYFQEQMDNLNQSLDILDLFCTNINKFNSLYEMIESIKALIQVNITDKTMDIVKFNNNLALDLIFHQIDFGDDLKINNAVDKLKLVLSTKSFKDINYFLKIFIVNLREERNFNSLPLIIDLILKSKAYTNTDLMQILEEKDFSLWISFLEKNLIRNELNLTNFLRIKNKFLNKTVDLLYEIKSEKGVVLYENLLSKIKQIDGTNISKLNDYLSKILHRASVNLEIVQKLPTKLEEWHHLLECDNSNTKKLSIDEILRLMQDPVKVQSGGVNESVKACMEATDKDGNILIKAILANAKNFNKHSIILDVNKKSIEEWQENDISEWAKCFKIHPRRTEIFSWSKKDTIDIISEVLSILIKAVFIYDHYPTGPRDVQLMSLLLFLDCDEKGRLGNIYTGEGKTLITVMLATCFALNGKKVDIVTSSKVLATRDSKKREKNSREGYKGFYEMFKLKASNNCDESCEAADNGETTRRDRYSECIVIYGETTYFQRDILLSQFFRKDIRTGSGIGDVLILDEVDNMMIDNAVKTLYISHNITDMRHLRDLFLYIWAAVNSADQLCYSDDNVKKIARYIESIIVMDDSNEENEVYDDLQISIPSTLKEFVEMNLEIWIKNAYYAKSLQVDNNYIIGDTESQKQNEIIIMDKDTGIEQFSTKWSNGLHQFIQLKHNAKISDESLKAVYLSNAGFFQNYRKLYGMTGTIGGTEERKLLNKVYEIDFFDMPRFKEYRFEYDFESESISGTVNEWLEKIIDNIEDNMDQELVFTDKDIELFKIKYKEELQSLTKQKELYRNLINKKKQIEEKLQVSQTKVTTFETLHDACKSELSKDEIRQLVKSYDEEILHELRNIMNSKESAELQNETKKLLIKMYKEKENVVNFNNSLSKLEEEIEHLIATIERSDEDVQFYKKLSATSKDQERDSRRAILLICDNIADLNLIENNIRKYFHDSNSYRIFKYDRAYRKFDASRLEAGDIVIATNIAGRGTDIDVSKQVEENGGLHVILTYMPKNLRIEKQAFGRTARSGNQGTGTYIVYEPRKQYEDIDVQQLKTERDEEETSRLAVINKQQLPKVILEDELFKEFNKLQQEISSKLRPRESVELNILPFLNFTYELNNTDWKVYHLHMNSLQNHWAIWLNKISSKFDELNDTVKQEILDNFQTFKEDIYRKLNSKYGLIQEPGELNKLGRLYLDNSKYSEALDCFEYIIKNHKSFSSIAHYYKSFCIIHMERGGYHGKLQAKKSLKKSLTMLENDRNRILGRNQILKSINEIARIRGRAQQSNYFAKQNEGEAQVLSVHINAIKTAIGSEMSPDLFRDEPQKIYDGLIKKGVVKDYRISKKCCVGSKLLIKDRVKQENILNNLKLSIENYNACMKFLEKYQMISKRYLSHDFVNNDAFNTLTKVKIVSTREIYDDNKQARFPDTFSYCKEAILDDIIKALNESKEDSWSYKKRIKTSSSFTNYVYTKEKFITDTTTFIKIDEVIKISNNIRDQLLGNLDHPIFCGYGDQIKHILVNNLTSVNLSILKNKFDSINDEMMFFDKKDEIKNYCLNLKERLYPTKEILDDMEKITGKLSGGLLNYLGLIGNKIILKKQLIDLIKEKTTLDEKQIDQILEHLETYESIRISHEFLKKKFKNVKKESIFFGKKDELKEFCIGLKKLTTTNGDIQLLDNQYYCKSDILTLLKTILKLPDELTSSDDTNFKALLTHLGFDNSTKLMAITSFQQYKLSESSMTKIKEFVEVINLKDANNDTETKNKIDEIDFSIDSRLRNKAGELSTIIKNHLHVNKPLKKEDLHIESESFALLRAMLIDANVIQTSIFNLLTGETKKMNQELESILTKIYYNNGLITDNDLVLKTSSSGSEELFRRLIELNVIKLPMVNYRLGEFKYVPKFVGGNYWKDDNDPEKRFDYIKKEIEKVIVDVFALERRQNYLHQINEVVTGGIGSESKNKELDEKIETVSLIIKQAIGTMKTMPEIKIESVDLRTMFNDGNVPPELMDYIHMLFDIVLDIKEVKGFDWDCFLCAMIGLAQIVAGVTLEILSGGSAHFIAQGLIAEGVGDICFAIQSAVHGNFSWKSYAQHKVQSLILTMITCGVGGLMVRGSKAGRFAIGLATKTEIAKAIAKTSLLEICGAVITSTVNIGVDKMCNCLIDDVLNIHLMETFDMWIKENNTHRQKMNTIEENLSNLYERFGIKTTKESIEICLERALGKSMSPNKVNELMSKVMNSVIKGYTMASQRLNKGQNQTSSLAMLTNIAAKMFETAPVINGLKDACTICNDFCDALNQELTMMNKTLTNQNKFAENDPNASITAEVIKDLANIREKMQFAFKTTVRDALLNPAISSIMHQAIKPIQGLITSPFANAMEKLLEHIDDRSKIFQQRIINQDDKSVAKINTKQKKALEMRGDITKLEDVNEPTILNAEVANFPGTTLQQLRTEHGADVSFMVKDGLIYAVLPTFKQYCSNLENGTLKISSEFNIKIAATKENKKIEIVSMDMHGTRDVIHYDGGPGTVTPLSTDTDETNTESFKIVYVPGNEGKIGHYAPIIKDENGYWKVINISQTGDTVDSCFGQTMVFLRSYEKCHNVEEARSLASQKSEVEKYYKALGKCVKNNDRIKEYYQQGITVRSDRIVGGRTPGEFEKEIENRNLGGRVHNLLKKVKSASNKKIKNLCRVMLANELFFVTPELTEEARLEILSLASAYNDRISAIIPFELEFSQDGINSYFSKGTTGTDFPHAGKSVLEVGQMKPFPVEDFVIKVFPHPYKDRVLVIENNRGAAAHAIAGVPIQRLELIDYASAKNKKAFLNRIGDGRTIKFDKNIISDKKISMKDITKDFKKFCTSTHKNLKNLYEFYDKKPKN